DSVNGADVRYRKTLGLVDISTQAYYGKTDAPLAAGPIHVRKLWGVNANITAGPLTLRAGRNQSSLTANSPATTQLLATVNAAGFTALANSLNPQNVPFDFTDFGFSLDGIHFTLQGEISKTTAGGFFASTRGEYLLAGS